MNCFTCESGKGYDAMINMVEYIEHLASDDETLELINIMNKNKDKKLVQTLGIAMLKLAPYMKRHKADVFGLVSNFFVRDIEETEKKSFLELKDELTEVFGNETVRQLFTSAQTKNAEECFGSVLENIEETV